jgi:hypothetical protein
MWSCRRVSSEIRLGEVDESREVVNSENAAGWLDEGVEDAGEVS